LTVLLAILGLFPLLAAFGGWGGQTILRTVETFILLALGLNIVLGLTGQLDLGFAASFGLGAYAAALLGRHDLVVQVLAGSVLAAMLGLFKGVLAGRLRGDFFAVATLALGLMVRQIVINLPEITGGASGRSGFSFPQALGVDLLSPTARFYLVFVAVVVAVWVSQRVLNSRTGRAWIASSEDEEAAQACGVNVGSARMLALMLGSAMAGAAGVMYASTFSYVDPETMSFHISSLILTMVILGGAGSVPGALWGAAAVVLYDKVLVPRFADWIALIWPSGLSIGSAPDIRGASFFNFGLALYLTVLWRSRRKK
jgi:branched-chain amino acid transport system permease protein